MGTTRHTLDPMQPSETVRYQADFSSSLNTSETITAISPTVTKASDSSDVTSTILQSYSESGGVVEFYLGSGTDGEQYYVDIDATTDGDQVLTLTGLVSCTEVGGT